MAKIEIYTTQICPFCHAAKDLLSQKGVSYHETDVMKEPGERAIMVKRANGVTSVPQIFIDGTHIGGCDELYALEQKGALDAIIG